jgi:branched-subunit amino acid aminotransferase/4-amino-4-deoxychorismate lyase
VTDPGDGTPAGSRRAVTAPGRVPDVALRETCRLVAGRVPLWPFHRARLASGGCGDEVLRAVDESVARQAADQAGVVSKRLRLTVVVTPDGHVDVRVQRRLSSLDVPGGPKVVAVRVDAPRVLPRGAAKPADRTWWDEAQRRARAVGGHQAVIVGPDGAVVDGGTATVWAVVEGAIVTPPAPDAIAGVARAFLLDALDRAGSPARVARLDARLLDCAEELLLTNAFGGAVAVRDRGGPVYERLRAMFADLWCG